MQKCLAVSIVGPTNAGKSTLINTLVGSKVSIVTHKVQTTRSTIRGIVNYKNSQLIFVDTPGIFSPKRGLEKLMVKTAWNELLDTEVNMLILDSDKGITENIQCIIKKLSAPTIAVLNKVDLLHKPRLLALSEKLNNLFSFDEIFMISALKNNGIQDLKEYLSAIAPEHPWVYPEEQVTDAPLKFTLAEITREKLFLRIHRELPYQLMVETEMINTDNKDETVVYQAVYVNSHNHKKILTGKNKSTLNNIIQRSRYDMEKMLKSPVMLNLFVKVKKEWISKQNIVCNIAY